MKNVSQKSLCTSKGNNIYKQFIAYLKEEERNFDPKIKISPKFRKTPYSATPCWCKMAKLFYVRLKTIL
jgi:hypothetical protein